jgi:hypothetical protein
MSNKKRKVVDSKPNLLSELHKTIWNDSTKRFILSLGGLGLFIIASIPQVNSASNSSSNSVVNQYRTGTVLDIFEDRKTETKYVNPYIGFYQKTFCSGNKKSIGCSELPISPITTTFEVYGYDVEEMNRQAALLFLEQGEGGYKDPYRTEREKKYSKSYSIEEIAQ